MDSRAAWVNYSLHVCNRGFKQVARRKASGRFVFAFEGALIEKRKKKKQQRRWKAQPLDFQSRIYSF